MLITHTSGQVHMGSGGEQMAKKLIVQEFFLIMFLIYATISIGYFDLFTRVIWKTKIVK